MSNVVQSATQNNGGTQATSQAFSSNVTAGNTLIAIFRVGTTIALAGTITVNDNLNAGNWTVVPGFPKEEAQGDLLTAYYKENTAGGSCTVSYAFNATSPLATLRLWQAEVATGGTSAVIDASNATGSINIAAGAGSINTPSITTATANCLLLAAFESGAAGETVTSNSSGSNPTNWINEADVATRKLFVDSTVVSSPGSYNEKWALVGTPDDFCTGIVAVKLPPLAIAVGPSAGFGATGSNASVTLAGCVAGNTVGMICLTDDGTPFQRPTCTGEVVTLCGEPFVSHWGGTDMQAQFATCTLASGGSKTFTTAGPTGGDGNYIIAWSFDKPAVFDTVAIPYWDRTQTSLASPQVNITTGGPHAAIFSFAFGGFDDTAAFPSTWTHLSVADVFTVMDGAYLLDSGSSAGQISIPWRLSASTPPLRFGICAASWLPVTGAAVRSIRAQTLSSDAYAPSGNNIETSFVAPLPNKFLIATLNAHFTALPSATAFSVTGNGLTWVRIAEIPYNTGGSARSLVVFGALTGTSPLGSDGAVFTKSDPAGYSGTTHTATVVQYDGVDLAIPIPGWGGTLSVGTGQNSTSGSLSLSAITIPGTPNGKDITCTIFGSQDNANDFVISPSSWSAALACGPGTETQAIQYNNTAQNQGPSWSWATTTVCAAAVGFILKAAAFDDFERLDGSIGGNWTTVAGTPSVFYAGAPDLGVAYGAASGNNAASWNDTFANDQYAQVTVDTIGGQDVGCYVRCQAGAFSCYLLDANPSNIAIWKVTAGSLSLLTSASISTPAAGDILRLEVSGTSIAAKINGTTKCSTTDSTYSSGAAGIWFNNTGGAARDFYAGPLTPPPTGSAVGAGNGAGTGAGVGRSTVNSVGAGNGTGTGAGVGRGVASGPTISAWYDPEMVPNAWFNAEINQSGWFDRETTATVQAGVGLGAGNGTSTGAGTSNALLTAVGAGSGTGTGAGVSNAAVPAVGAGNGTSSGAATGTAAIQAVGVGNAGGSTAVSDNFNRADTTAIYGTNWVKPASTFGNDVGISSNAAKGNASGHGYAIWQGSTIGPDQYAEITVGVAGHFNALILRADASAVNFYVAYISTTSGGCYLQRSDGGAITTPSGAPGPTGGNPTTGDRYRFEVSGQGTSTTLKAYKNGGLLWTYTDTSGTAFSSGQPGFGLRDNVVTGDDWAGGGLTGGGGGTGAATGVALTNATGAGNGTSTGAGVGQSTAASVGAGNGTSTGAGVGRALANSVGAGNGTSTGAGVGPSGSIGAGNATSTGAATGNANFAGVGAGNATSSGAATGKATTNATGVGNATTTGAGVGASRAAATGAGNATSTGNAVTGTAGIGNGTSTGAGVGVALFAGVGVGNGTGTGAGVGKASTNAVGAGNATSTGAATGVALAIGVGAGNSTSTGAGVGSGGNGATGVGNGTTTGAATGKATANSVGAGNGTSTGAASGTGSVFAVGAGNGTTTGAGISGVTNVGHGDGTTTGAATSKVTANSAGAGNGTSTGSGAASALAKSVGAGNSTTSGAAVGVRAGVGVGVGSGVTTGAGFSRVIAASVGGGIGSGTGAGVGHQIGLSTQRKPTTGVGREGFGDTRPASDFEKRPGSESAKRPVA